VMTLRWHAEACDKLYDQLSPSGPGKVGMVVREPVGVVGAVLPWNYPLMMAGWKIGPILAAGNTCVVKPAEQTSMSTIRVAELAVEAGIPDGVLNVVPGFGETAGAAIGLHPDVDCVAFTGSTEVGRHFLRYSADSNLKEVLLECGGKSPVIVMADADDLDAAATGICEGIFWNGGQNCSANSRLIVQRSVRDELMERIAERSRDWVVGDPLVPETTVGAMIEETHMDKVLGHIADAHAAGSTCAIGGNRVRVESGGWFVEPTVFTNVDPSSRLAREEVFGPVLAVTTFDTPEEAIRLANDTDYGLAATIHTTDLRTAHLASRAIRAGTVAVNCYGEGDITTPFGGFKQSGFGGRDKSIAAHEQYTELKTIWMDLS
jgi:gamma-glutamyl-gamma-aminobutyraldehyde dehydrogenase